MDGLEGVDMGEDSGVERIKAKATFRDILFGSGVDNTVVIPSSINNNNSQEC